MSEMNNSKPTAMTRFFALLLMVGGVVGIAVFIWLATQSQMHAALIIFLAIFVFVFVWSALKGLDLWRGKPSGYKWAKILFAAQVPNLTFPGFNYEFYTGLNVAVLFGQAGQNFSFNLGSSASLYISPEVAGTVIGLNLVALAALMYFLVAKRAQ